MNTQLQIFLTFLLLVAAGAGATGWYAGISRVEETEKRFAALQTEHYATLNSDINRLASEASALRVSLAEQQIIVAEEAAEVRDVLDERVAELSTTIGTHQQAITGLSTTADVAGLIERWSPHVYDITCDFKGTGTVDDDTGSGSATLMRENGQTVFVTNAHVVEEEGGVLTGCRLEQRGRDSQTINVDADDITIDEDVDVARGILRDTAGTIAIEASGVCSSDPRIGERIITLGYPTIGGKESITVTEGIIAGFDDDFYTTTAKIEKGNSGGAAVSIERGCFLGLPTLVIAGRIESLARILPALSL